MGAYHDAELIEKAVASDAAMRKFGSLVERLVAKMGMSQTPVPGFAVGLSGTDSVVAFLALSAACHEMGIPDRMLGVHYVSAGRTKPSWFEASVIPWLLERCPDAEFATVVPLGGNQDPQRWADLHLRARNRVVVGEDGAVSIRERERGRTYWVSGTINATERALGKFTMLADAVSIQPINSLWKTDVLAICEAFGVPRVAVDNARVPDCLCGRDEFAAENIELVDEVLRLTFRAELTDPTKLARAVEWVADQKRAGSFRARVPYKV
jgi:hypothetical protein